MIIQDAINQGFVFKGYNKKDTYNQSDNWNGCSLQSPDKYFERGTKSIFLSLNGLGGSLKDEKGRRNFKLIELRDGNQMHYINWDGILPDEITWKTFIKL